MKAASTVRRGDHVLAHVGQPVPTLLLGVLLLKMAMNPTFGNMEDYLLSIVLNLCIGLSMLFIPIAARSLINDGMESAASALASAPAMAAATTAKLYASKMVKSGAAKTWESGKFMAKPITNPVSARISKVRDQVEPRIRHFKEDYAGINTPGRTYRKKMEKAQRAYGISSKNKGEA